MILDDSEGQTTKAENLTTLLQGATLSNGSNKEGNKGVNIDAVQKDSPAAMSGLQPGDLIIGVNNQRVMTIVELRKIIDSKPSVLALNILRGDDNIYLLLNNAGR